VLERFGREARLGGILRHANVVDVLDFGVHEGSPYMVMELLVGESLGARLERLGRLPVSDAARILSEVLAGLGAAHACGVIHRDLKPDNIFLTNCDDGGECAKVLDFGISKSIEDQVLERGLTRCGTVLGTPEYMAPEQALARPDMDHRADLYSAGVVLYQMVTGVLPFQLADENELLAEVAFQPNGVPPPRRHVPTLPRAFEAVVLRALSRDRERRYPDAAPFIAALEPWTRWAGAAAPEPVDVLEIEPEGKEESNTREELVVVPPPAQLPASLSPVEAASREDSRPLPGMAMGRRPAVLRGLALAALVGIGSAGLLRRAPGGHTPPVQGHASIATAARARPAAPVPEAPVTVELLGLPAGANVLVDGETTRDSRLSFSRGSTHVIRVTAPGLRPYETTITAMRDHAIELAPVPRIEAATPPQPAPPRAASRVTRAQRWRRAVHTPPRTAPAQATSAAPSRASGVLPLETQF
jgi:hypothetical protein